MKLAKHVYGRVRNDEADNAGVYRGANERGVEHDQDSRVVDLTTMDGPVRALGWTTPARSQSATKAKTSELPYNYRSPWLAGGLSLVVPGTGQMYNGQYVVGGIILAAEIGCYLAAFAYANAFRPGAAFELSLESALMFAVAGGIHVFSVFDAITEAQRMNDNLERFALVYNPFDSSFAMAYRFSW